MARRLSSSARMRLMVAGTPALIPAHDARARSAKKSACARPDAIRFVRLLPELLQGELADRLQHGEARLALRLVEIWRTRLLSTSEAIPSSTSSVASGLATASAASSVQPPAKTASRRKRVCSSAVSRSWLQAIVSRSVCWRCGRSRAPPVSRGRVALQPRQKRLGRQELDAGGGQFQRQRQPIHPPANLGDDRPRCPASARSRVAGCAHA